MALPKFYKVCQDQQGNIVPQVLGSVFNHGTAVLASLYQDDAGTLPLANPMTSDAQYGSFKFYVNPGHYDLTFTKPGYTFEPIDDMQVPADTVTLGTMAQQNANAVAITGGSATLETANVGGYTATWAGNPSQAVSIPDAPAGAHQGLLGQMSDGANRYNLYCSGTAPSYLLGKLGLGALPLGSYQATLSFPKDTLHGLAIQQRNSDVAAQSSVVFLNTASGVAGAILCTATTTTYGTSSDARLKHAVQALSGALDAVRALRPVRWRWNVDDAQDEGFLAHELQQVLPRAVHGMPDEVNPDGSVKPQQVDHSKLVVWLVGAVQDLAGQVQALTQRVTSLEEQLGL